MRGMPNTLNTKNDYMYIKNVAPASVWKPKFKALLDSATAMYPIGEVGGNGDWLNDDTYQVVEIDGKCYQYEKRINENAKLFRIGFTVEEVESILQEEE